MLYSCQNDVTGLKTFRISLPSAIYEIALCICVGDVVVPLVFLKFSSKAPAYERTSMKGGAINYYGEVGSFRLRECCSIPARKRRLEQLRKSKMHINYRLGWFRLIIVGVGEYLSAECSLRERRE